MIRTYLRNLFGVPNKSWTQLLGKIIIGLQYYPEWRQSLDARNALWDGAPWVTFEARDFIKSILAPSAIVFEYGSGGSTLFYSGRAKRVISIEHDANWANLVEGALLRAGIKNCEYRLIPPEMTSRHNGSPDDPKAYCSGGGQYRGYTFYEYVISIESFPDQFFDFVAIDGRARPSSILHGHPKVKIGGYLILDNSERPYYQRATLLVSDWEKSEFYGPGPYNHNFWETTIWRRLK